MVPKLEADLLGMGVGLGVGEDSMDAGGPPSVGSMEAQPVLSNTQTPVSTKKVGFICLQKNNRSPEYHFSFYDFHLRLFHSVTFWFHHLCICTMKANSNMPAYRELKYLQW